MIVGTMPAVAVTVTWVTVETAVVPSDVNCRAVSRCPPAVRAVVGAR